MNKLEKCKELVEELQKILISIGVDDDDNIEDKKIAKENVKGYNIICSKCKKPSTVPFEPNKAWPILCYDCYKKK